MIEDLSLIYLPLKIGEIRKAAINPLLENWPINDWTIKRGTVYKAKLMANAGIREVTEIENNKHDY